MCDDFFFFTSRHLWGMKYVFCTIFIVYIQSECYKNYIAEMLFKNVCVFREMVPRPRVCIYMWTGFSYAESLRVGKQDLSLKK